MNGHRKAIRKRIKEILVAAADSLGVAANKIYSNRTHEVVAGNSKLPAIIINTLTEDVLGLPIDSSFREYELQLPIQVDCIVQTAGEIGDTLDDFMEAVLYELLKHDADQANSVQPEWGDLRYVRSSQVLDESGKKTIGVGSITINVIYQAEAHTVTPVDYAGSDITYRLKAHLSNAEQGQLEVSDEYDDNPGDDN